MKWPNSTTVGWVTGWLLFAIGAADALELGGYASGHPLLGFIAGPTKSPSVLGGPLVAHSEANACLRSHCTLRRLQRSSWLKRRRGQSAALTTHCLILPDDQAETVKDGRVLSQTKQWLEDFIIGLNLCPYAKGPYAQDIVRYSVSDAADVS